jgi:hypothetical protein
MSIPLALMTRLIQLASERKFAEAERILQRITLKIGKGDKKEFNKGYIDALSGIILTYRSSSESYELFNKLNLDDISALKKQYKDFVNHTKSRFNADYDKGYFSALAEYLRIILKKKAVLAHVKKE